MLCPVPPDEKLIRMIPPNPQGSSRRRPHVVDYLYRIPSAPSRIRPVTMKIRPGQRSGFGPVRAGNCLSSRKNMSGRQDRDQPARGCHSGACQSAQQRVRYRFERTPPAAIVRDHKPEPMPQPQKRRQAGSLGWVGDLRRHPESLRKSINLWSENGRFDACGPETVPRAPRFHRDCDRRGAAMSAQSADWIGIVHDPAPVSGNSVSARRYSAARSCAVNWWVDCTAMATCFGCRRALSASKSTGPVSSSGQ